MSPCTFSGQRLLEEFESHLNEEETRKQDAQKRLEKSSRILTDVKSGVEHLAEKLKHLKAVSWFQNDFTLSNVIFFINAMSEEVHSKRSSIA